MVVKEVSNSVEQVAMKENSEKSDPKHMIPSESCNTARRLDSATVSVSSRTSRIEKLPQRNLPSGNLEGELDSDSDISFNQDQDTVIEHQSQRAIQL